jgi:hypothetical protein
MASGSAPVSGRGVALQRLQESYMRRLDEKVNQLVDLYGNILRAAKVYLFDDFYLMFNRLAIESKIEARIFN